MGRIGITTTVPIEALFAAGHQPVDLNNVFVSHPERRAFLERAEAAGFPASTCAWIKGIYAAAKVTGVDAVVGVMAGDCSNTQALLEVWQFEGLRTIPFSYPYDRSPEALRGEIERLCRKLGTTFEAAETEKVRLDACRAGAMEVDRLSWEEDRVTGFESHLYQVSASDFEGDPEGYRAKVDAFLAEARRRPSLSHPLRLGYVGVPPILEGLYDLLESRGARVVFNETQRQFSLPYPDASLVDAYLRFTYPYDVFGRIEDIRREIGRRRIHGIIHYVQAFCFRQMEDLILRKTLGVPVLTLEGDRPGAVDARTLTRIEGFLEMLEGRADP
ncbi:MAG: 2-hydroxyacyl-CoA dehydratase [Deltaproteobacteria bacterium]|nr:2-hydroxyacyl-CoA dehydratase [Deltaproteobacteria bacterium]